MSGFTHFDEKGNAVMVDVHEKADTYSKRMRERYSPVKRQKTRRRF